MPEREREWEWEWERERDEGVKGVEMIGRVRKRLMTLCTSSAVGDSGVIKRGRLRVDATGRAKESFVGVCD
jgi:hypothetical protein